MKRLRILLASSGLLLALVTPVIVAGSASAQVALDTNPIVQCPTNDGEFTNPNTGQCDIAIDKQVSVNGGAYLDADTSTDAASAHVGDTITWKITVTNQSNDLIPHGTIYVKDVLPTGVTYVSYTATAGEYHPADGSFFENSWYLPLLNSDFNTNLPATLTITTTANAVGSVQNTAYLWKYDQGSCDGGCVYADADASNDSNDAWVNIQAVPQVLGESTTSDPQVLGLTDTGTSTTLQTIFALLLIGAAISLGAYGRLSKKKHYRI